MIELPPYGVRESPRARNVRLTVTARDGLVVVVPRRFPRRRIPFIVESRIEWIERAMERVREQREALLAGREQVPAYLELPGIGLAWPLIYRATLTDGARVRLVPPAVHVTGAIADVEAVQTALLRFCRARAAEELPRMLEELSAEQGLPFASVKVRGQRTRWGSCSARGSINLNWKLAFLPPELARFVLLHELVHTLQLDHSPRFRALLAEREPRAAELTARLRAEWRHVPAWASDG